ncbi:MULTISPECIES: DNA-3-methyladenine glycosylase [unclassified Imperialibacter]|uniref:DNA-3-methyladenine glycosylase family protein n=1 Tax=unclassified Imperialibacter TaxID=2629706 RepID=UPI00125665E9|nr:MULTISPECIES: DNA glycosylase [unclassified Imperialibacter]CAD5258804.1 DNA-3-methyladenine glycosylase II [Imperialibacter sp. 89]CAD5265753.1 DNA-3-methyladenine glycosylase II [Imperialibacter sp. 75]VVT21428.1 DNA-3-methyladenine glycosylase II [Imperialibacter sp. EC-SDR9]
MPLSFSIATPNNFSFKECLWFLDRGFDDCLHKVQGGSVTKLLRIGDQGHSLLRVSESDGALRVDLLKGEARESEVIDYITEWLHLEGDVAPLKAIARRDADLEQLVEKYWGLRLISIPDLFEVLCWSIIGQQINLTFAYKLKRSLVEAVGESETYEGQTYHVFPSPKQVLELSFDDLKAMQYSSQKANYLHIVAEAFLAGEISVEKLSLMESTPEMLKCLMSLKGVGEWTANYVAMKCLRRPDALTYGDAGLLNGYKQLKGLDRKPTREELETFFGQFPGWEAYIVFYIWRSLA